MPRQDTDRVYDELLVTLARSGDRKAANRLAARWYPRLMRTALRLLRDRSEAEEAVQEAWAGICRGWPRLSDPAMFPGWAFGILRRKCADRIRKAQGQRARAAPLEAAPEPSQPARGELRVEIDQALAELSPRSPPRRGALFRRRAQPQRDCRCDRKPRLERPKSRVLFMRRQQLKSTLKGETDDEF